MQVPFYKIDVGSKEQQKIIDVLNGDAFYAVEDLEDNFQSYVGASYAVSTSSGTGALHLAMLAIDLKRGDKVLCSVNAHPAVPEVVRHFDAEPTFIDIDADTFNINLDSLENYLEDNQTKKLKAVIVSHAAGQPLDLTRLYNIAKIYKIKIIEDAGDALGATYQGEKIGATGADITCFSFSQHLKKGICQGGMLVTEDEEIMERAKLLRNHAVVTDEDSLEYIYDVTAIGNKYTMSDLDAAFIDVQLSRQDQIVARQQAIATRYMEKLQNVDHVSLPVVTQDHAYSNFIIKIDKNRDSFARELESRGIATGIHYIPLHLMSYYKTKYMLRINDFPMALRNYQSILSIPVYAAMSDKEVDYICDAIKEVAKTRV